MPEPNEIDGSPENTQKGSTVGEMHARREEMADGERYIIYYTFSEEDEKGGEDV